MREIGRHLADYADLHFPREFELFKRVSSGGGALPAGLILREISHNHAVDAMHAEDLSAELRRLSGSLRAEPPGELAYMLRCYFDGCRRAMAYEELALLNLGEERLTPAATSALLLSFHAG